MGALRDNVCYSWQADAVDSFYLSAPITITSGSASYATKFEKVAGVWKSQGYSIGTTGTWSLRFTTNAPVPVFPTCNEYEGIQDGIAVGWLVASAMIIAVALLKLKIGAR